MRDHLIVLFVLTVHEFFCCKVQICILHPFTFSSHSNGNNGNRGLLYQCCLLDSLKNTVEEDRRPNIYIDVPTPLFLRASDLISSDFTK